MQGTNKVCSTVRIDVIRRYEILRRRMTGRLWYLLVTYYLQTRLPVASWIGTEIRRSMPKLASPDQPNFSELRAL